MPTRAHRTSLRASQPHPAAEVDRDQPLPAAVRLTPSPRADEPSSPLAATPDEFARLAARAACIAAQHYAGRPDKPVYELMPGRARERLLNLELPEQGLASEAILDLFAEAVMAFDMGNQRPTFAAWVNPAAAPIGMLLDFLAGVMNPTAAKGNHAATYVEERVVGWLRELMGFPPGTDGMLVDGGSLANLHGLAAALQAACAADGWDLQRDGLAGAPWRYLVYTSAEVHSCVRKSARLLGLGEPRVIGVDARRRLDGRELAARIRADRAQGARPFCVVASAGTVNTGAIDPIEELADLCQAERLWLHVDGAYGAFGKLDPAVVHLYRGLERADSLALDPHKWLAVPNTCSCILVRDGARLAQTFGFQASYLSFETETGFGAGKRFDHMGVYQTRRFLAAKLLGVLLQLGREGLREHVARHNRLARRMTAMVDAEPELERLGEGDLTIVCFRYVPRRLRGDEARLDRLNRCLVERLQLGGRAFVSGTELDGRFVVRSCALHYDLTEADVRVIVDATLDAGREVLAELSPRGLR
ncbi:MAG: pyridoxal-dependent decarboxylase [Candidatus Dormibacteraeota bacterium]|nr:pyridoxal-dependent decarboxylase [Candidatus Dormibacteraeota bacterium]